MPSSPRLPTTTSKLQSMLIPRPPRVTLLPLQSVWQPARLPTPGNVRARFNSSLGQEWKGSSTDDHAVKRSKDKRDITDPQTESSASGLKEKKESAGVADQSKQGAVTEREGLKQERQAKKEHPKAPEPIIGMNDERAEVSATCPFPPETVVVGNVSPG
ncbi:hypothetical protein ALT_7915 [Aspergillus lentulus]|uniref:Uncharacterized protein n=1 Tax=Aspergillus lentulus TaxID=293939 RepID=A0AAN5YU92_ASPLE|nr:uncharacterized protein IFM58399_01379 [Aspergillus lentulus]KAF4155992.1 hypothetical protein CNMCM6069_007305 [Aspergillus lentulus]KAF4168983.1 hypothetical protein CNMCM6936_000394 [Aspergillus lentulus]KAF4182460.1 hypothetical protein CNMCM8060_006864 [Aspergillus lentulus]KAF4186696.1 hypothetical protein CNMCM7927_005240 [Aspergillus lentulus]KAF4199043.1 hypothetical protein CNMCM8694_006796 [Aspergillus lentulus]